MRKCLHILPFILFLCLAAQSCSVQSLHEAQTVVAEADSLRTQGLPYTDSMLMAQAYTTLGNWQYFYPDDYAHACYHYGRILRNNDNPAEAMQAFINATHSRTKDYHILGRVYSNMGSICHLAGEYEFSYNMYSRAADYFINNGDTINYYYALNDMALELAVQGKKEETLSLTNRIEQECMDAGVLLRAHETIAEMYRLVEEYDSAIYYLYKAKQYGDISSYGTIIKAQSFFRLGMPDSANYYAELIMTDSTVPYNAKFNALYIISHNDSTLSKDSALALASQREDIRYYEYEPEQEKLAVAVQLLEKDLARKWDWREWLVLILIISIGIISALYILIGYRRKQLMEQRVTTLANTITDDILTSIKQHIDINNLNYTLHWKNYAAMKVDADLYMGGIVSKLETYKLNEVEIRFCILTLLDMKLKQIAETIHYSYPSGIKTLKKRISDKLGTTPPFLKEYIFKIITNTTF